MKTITYSLIAVSALALGGCLNSDDDDDNNSDGQAPEEPSSSYLRVTHASSDAPLVSISLDGTVVSGLGMVDYQQGSGLLAVDPGTYAVAVDALLPGDSSATVISANLPLESDMQYDVIAVNYAASIEPVVLGRSAEAVASDSIRLDVLHAHPDVPGVDIYLSTSETIDDVDPAISGLEFKADSDVLPVTIPSGTYRIRITLAGDSAVVFDSGDLDLAGGSDFMITAVPNVSGGAVSPVNLLLGSADGVGVIRNTGEQATVRVVHAVQDAPAVDVLAGGMPTGFVGVAFKDFASADLPAGEYDLSVVPSGTTEPVVIDAPGVSFAAGSTTSIYAVGDLNDVTDETIDPLVISEDLRSVALFAKLRVVHASTAAEGIGPVDIHASADGNFSQDTVVLAGIGLNANAVLEVPGGFYTFAVAEAGTLNTLIVTSATLMNGGVYSAVATNDLSDLVLNVDTDPAGEM